MRSLTILAASAKVPKRFETMNVTLEVTETMGEMQGHSEELKAKVVAKMTLPNAVDEGAIRSRPPLLRRALIKPLGYTFVHEMPA